MDGQLDVAMVSMQEQKFEKARFTRVDSDVIERLVVKSDEQLASSLNTAEQAAISSIFSSQLPSIDKVDFHVATQALGEQETPILITQSEYMRRMKEMAHIQSGMSFYGEMPDMFNLVLNTDHPLIQRVLKEGSEACADRIAPLHDKRSNQENRLQALREAHRGKKAEDIPSAETAEVDDLEKAIADIKQEEQAVYSNYAQGNKVVRQLIDLALLRNQMLKGEALNNFVKRSIELI